MPSHVSPVSHVSHVSPVTNTTVTSMNRTVIVIILVFGLFRFCLSITEAITLNQYSELKNGCNQVWIQVLVMCVIGLVLNTCTLCGTLPFILDELNIESRSTRGELIHLGGLGVNIWIQYTYFNISDSCRSSYQEYAPALWTLFFIEWIMFYVYIGLGVLAILTMCCGVCSIMTTNIQKRAIAADNV